MYNSLFISYSLEKKENSRVFLIDGKRILFPAIVIASGMAVLFFSMFFSFYIYGSPVNSENFLIPGIILAILIYLFYYVIRKYYLLYVKIESSHEGLSVYTRKDGKDEIKISIPKEESPELHCERVWPPYIRVSGALLWKPYHLYIKYHRYGKEQIIDFLPKQVYRMSYGFFYMHEIKEISDFLKVKLIEDEKK